MPINFTRKMKIFYSAWKTWHHLLPKMTIVKCNPKVHYKISNQWIQAKKFFRQNKFFLFSFFLCFYAHQSFSFCTCAKKKTALMSEFLSVCVCIYISLSKAKQQNQIAQICAHFYSSFHVFFFFFFFYLSPCVLIKI